MALHWWHTHKLTEALSADSVTEQESLWYAILNAVIASQILYYAYWFGGERGWLLLLEFAAVCVVSLIGLHECFKSNGGGNGSHFLKRLFCLGVPVGLKLAIASALVGQIIISGFPGLLRVARFEIPTSYIS